MFVELITAKLPWCFNENIESFNYAIYKVHLSQVGRERMTKRAGREGSRRGEGKGEGRGREGGERKGGGGEEGRERERKGGEWKGRRERMETEGSYHLSPGWLLQ